jgi:hypothetical protein
MRTGSRLRVNKKTSKPNLQAAGPGRPPGRQNNSTLEGRAVCLKIVEDKRYRRALWQRMLNGTAGQMEVLCWYYAYGKPKETLDISKTEHTEHYHFYLPDNGRTTPAILNPTNGGATRAEGVSNGHALCLPPNGRSGTD